MKNTIIFDNKIDFKQGETLTFFLNENFDFRVESRIFSAQTLNKIQVYLKNLKFKKILGIEPAKNLAKLTNRQKIKTYNGFLDKKSLKKIRGNADLVLASNVFAHSNELKTMAECMLKLIKKDGTIIIEVQYLLNTLKDSTFDNIYHEHYNYWSLTSLITFFKRFSAVIYKAEKIDTHGGSLRIYIKKNSQTKIEKSVKLLLNEEEKFGIKNYQTYNQCCLYLKA